MIFGRQVCLMMGLFDARESFAWKQIGSGERAPHIRKYGAVWRVQTLAWHDFNRFAVLNSYEAGWVSASVLKWFIADGHVCFFWKLTVLLPSRCWLLYRAALHNDIYTNTATSGWTKAAFSDISSSLSNRKLPAHSGIIRPSTASNGQHLLAFQSGLTFPSSGSTVQECPKQTSYNIPVVTVFNSPYYMYINQQDAQNSCD